MRGPFDTITDIHLANDAIGHHFFEVDTMRFFNSRIESSVMGGRYFVTSERMEMWMPKRYTLRRANDDGSIETVGKFQAYRTKIEAIDAVESRVQATDDGGLFFPEDTEAVLGELTTAMVALYLRFHGVVVEVTE